MSKKFLVILSIVVSIFGFFVFSNYGGAAECKLTSAFWNKTSAAVGQQVKMTVRGQDCKDYEAAINIYQDIPGPFGLHIREVPAKAKFLTNTEATLNYVFKQEDYNKTVRLSGSQSVSMYFKADTGSIVESGNLTLSQSSGPGGPAPGPGGPIPGETTTVPFEIPNPVQAESLIDLAKAIGKFIFQIAIPIAVIVIIYAGILFLTSQGKPEQIKKAKSALLYAVVGLTIILIGQGFFTLIKSILDLG